MPSSRRAVSFLILNFAAVAAFLAATAYGYWQSSAQVPAEALAEARGLAVGAAAALDRTANPAGALATLAAEQPGVRSVALLARESGGDRVEWAAGPHAPGAGELLPAGVDGSVDASASLEPSAGGADARVVAYARLATSGVGERFLRLELDGGHIGEQLALLRRLFLLIALVGSGCIAAVGGLTAARVGRPATAPSGALPHADRQAEAVAASAHPASGRPEAHHLQTIEDLRRSRNEWEALFHDTIQTVAAALDQRDGYSGGHAEEVARLSDLVAERLGLSADARRALRYAAMLHDIGKISVPDAILHKPGPLTPGEMAVMRNHVNVGWRLLSRISALRGVARIAATHHERFDGTGYPAGLAGEDIPIEARILAAVDAFQAMVTDRVYRPAMPLRRALEELQRGSGTQFDPQVVDALIGVVGSRLGARESRRVASAHPTAAARDNAP